MSVAWLPTFTNNVGHNSVFCRVGGTGKTTLMRAIMIAAAVLLVWMILVTHTYSAAHNDASPAKWLRSALCVIDGGCDDDQLGEDYTEHGLQRQLEAAFEGP